MKRIRDSNNNKRQTSKPKYKKTLKQELYKISQEILQNIRDGKTDITMDLTYLKYHRDIVKNEKLLDKEMRRLSKTIKSALRIKFIQDKVLAEEDVTNYINIRFDINPNLMPENREIMCKELLSDGWKVSYVQDHDIFIEKRPYDWGIEYHPL